MSEKKEEMMLRHVRCLQNRVARHAFLRSLFEDLVTCKTAEEARKIARREDEPLFFGEERGRPLWLFYRRNKP